VEIYQFERLSETIKEKLEVKSSLCFTNYHDMSTYQLLN